MKEDNLTKVLPYGPIEVHDNFTINHIKIEVNYWDYMIRVNITPIMIDDISYSICYDGKREHQGFFVTALQCSRKSPKKMDMIARALWPYTDRIVELFGQGKFIEIANMITELVKDLNIKRETA